MPCDAITKRLESLTVVPSLHDVYLVVAGPKTRIDARFPQLLVLGLPHVCIADRT